MQMTESPKRVLLAEDNPVNQEVARCILESLGYEVDVAPDGRAAVEAFSRNSYVLILMDCQMPEVDGYEATRFIREIEASQSISYAPHPPGRVPIIALTGFATAEEKARCLQVGMDDLLGKPFTIFHLQNAMERWLAVSKPR